MCAHAQVLILFTSLYYPTHDVWISIHYDELPKEGKEKINKHTNIQKPPNLTIKRQNNHQKHTQDDAQSTKKLNYYDSQ